MRISATSADSGGPLVFAIGLLLSVFPGHVDAQAFDATPSLRPPVEVPGGSPGPAQSLAPPSTGAIPVAPRGPMLQSLPPAASPTPGPSTAAPSGQTTLGVSARFGRELAAIPAGLHWRIYPARAEGALRPLKDEKSAAPTFALAPGTYVVHVGFGLAGATKVVQLHSGEQLREVFEIPAGGLRLEGKVGDARIPPGQITFDLYKGSQFEPGDKRPIAQAVPSGDVIMVAEGTYHIVSNYGDGNSVVRSDIRVQAGKLTDAIVTHRAAIITLKLVNEWGGEARANTQWSVLTPGGDVIKESIGAFPRVILAEGDYRVIARNDDKTYDRTFRVVTGVDGEVEVLAR